MSSDPRWRRRKKARPQEILYAAVKVFADKGFARARMEDIADAAGVTKGTIYLYFDSKETVFRRLVREMLAVRAEAIAEAVRSSDLPAAVLLRQVLAIPAALLANDDPRIALPKIVLAEAGNFPELAEFYRREVIEPGMEGLEALITHGIARGEFRAVDPAHAARLCFAPMILALAWRTTFARFDETPYDYLGLMETHIDVLLHGLLPEETE